MTLHSDRNMERARSGVELGPGPLWWVAHAIGGFGIGGVFLVWGLVVLSRGEIRIPLAVAGRLVLRDGATAGVYVQLRDPDKADESIRRTLALQPDNSGAYLQLAQVALLRRQPEEALRLMSQALELDRGSRKAPILNAIGDFHLRRAAIEEARASFQQALEVDAFSGEAHGGLAEILLNEGDDAQALQHLETALRFNPVQPRVLAVLGGCTAIRAATRKRSSAASACLK
ncbi:MAG: tetratricopeptide repeat protein [Planctomycetes bacterium]|nr:tetratricopeptide repeat protein [Planctomycetota bacterium]